MAQERKSSRADAVRTAVDQAFSATAGQGAAAGERAQDLVEQLSQAAVRVRDVIDELRPPTLDELKALQKTVADLEQRVAALEADKAEATPRAKRAPAKKKSD